VVLGVAIGSVIARYAPADLFKWVFVIVAGISAIRLLFGKDSWRLGLDMPAKPIMIAYGWLIGILSALMGIGGGQLSNLFMTFYNRPIHQAVATSSGLGILISIPGALGYIWRIIRTCSPSSRRSRSAMCRFSAWCCSSRPAPGWHPSEPAWRIACPSAGSKWHSASSCSSSA
jgi:hypothetical protein